MELVHGQDPTRSFGAAATLIDALTAGAEVGPSSGSSLKDSEWTRFSSRSVIKSRIGIRKKRSKSQKVTCAFIHTNAQNRQNDGLLP